MQYKEVVHTFMDVDRIIVSREFQISLIGKASYIDALLKEYLYCPDHIREYADKNISGLSKSVLAELHVIEDLMNSMDCNYFRIIN